MDELSAASNRSLFLKAFDDGLRKVTAYPMEHPLECYGYRIEEHDKPGALNAQALKAAGVPPGPLFQELKAGKTIMLDDGRQINGADYLAAQCRGKSARYFRRYRPLRCPRWSLLKAST